MSKVVLKLIGGDNKKTVDIPVGKTILGRGPLLGCSDKKVSRSHAALDVSANGDIFLTPTHVNPCFYRTKDETVLKVIKKDKAQKIESGDFISLLPTSYLYEVTVFPDSKSSRLKESSERISKENKDSNDGSLHKEDSNSLSDEKSANKTKDKNEKENVDFESSPVKEVIDVDKDGDESVEAEADKEGTSQETKKRTLPNWLLDSSTIPKQKAKQTENKNTKKKSNKDENSKSVVTEKNISRTARQQQTNQRISLDDFEASDEDWDSEDSDDNYKPNARRKKGMDSSGSDWEFEHRNSNNKRRGGDSSDSDWTSTKKRRRNVRKYKDSDSGSDWERANKKKKATPKKERPVRKSRRVEPKSEESEEEEEENQIVAKNKREPCLYGKKCYRKNTSHFDVYSHPGDSDYTSPDENEEEKKEEGRKNQKKQNSKNQRPQRKAAKKGGNSFAEGDEDEDVSLEESDDYNPESDAS